MKRLMAKHQIDAGVVHVERRDIAVMEFNGNPLVRRLDSGKLQTILFGIWRRCFAC